jgi:hypothetical protein
MSFVVRQKSTGQYLQSQEHWTTAVEEALRFPSGMNLIQYIEKLSPKLAQDSLEIEVIPNPIPVALQ